jgi:hypothetical protein
MSTLFDTLQLFKTVNRSQFSRIYRLLENKLEVINNIVSLYQSDYISIHKKQIIGEIAQLVRAHDT